MKLRLIIILILFVFVCSCGGRIPKPSRSQSIIQHYFNKYAKKYPDTIYGQNGVKEVEIESQNEIRKNYVSVESFLTLGNGTLKRIFVTVKNNGFGWRFSSWEDTTN